MAGRCTRESRSRQRQLEERLERRGPAPRRAAASCPRARRSSRTRAAPRAAPGRRGAPSARRRPGFARSTSAASTTKSTGTTLSGATASPRQRQRDRERRRDEEDGEGVRPLEAVDLAGARVAHHDARPVDGRGQLGLRAADEHLRLELALLVARCGTAGRIAELVLEDDADAVARDVRGGEVVEPLEPPRAPGRARARCASPPRSRARMSRGSAPSQRDRREVPDVGHGGARAP